MWRRAMFSMALRSIYRSCAPHAACVLRTRSPPPSPHTFITRVLCGANFCRKKIFFKLNFLNSFESHGFYAKVLAQRREFEHLASFALTSIGAQSRTRTRCPGVSGVRTGGDRRARARLSLSNLCLSLLSSRRCKRARALVHSRRYDRRLARA